MADIVAAGRELYAALASGDDEALGRLLAPNFQGRLSEGLPLGLGGGFDGLDAMMGAWGTLAKSFDLAPEPEELIGGGAVLVARGSYVGTARATGRPLRAAFAHFWAFDGACFTSVRQVTDTALWRDALA